MVNNSGTRFVVKLLRAPRGIKLEVRWQRTSFHLVLIELDRGSGLRTGVSHGGEELRCTLTFIAKP